MEYRPCVTALVPTCALAREPSEHPCRSELTYISDGVYPFPLYWTPPPPNIKFPSALFNGWGGLISRGGDHASMHQPSKTATSSVHNSIRAAVHLCIHAHTSIHEASVYQCIHDSATMTSINKTVKVNVPLPNLSNIRPRDHQLTLEHP